MTKAELTELRYKTTLCPIAAGESERLFRGHATHCETLKELHRTKVFDTRLKCLDALRRWYRKQRREMT